MARFSIKNLFSAQESPSSPEEGGEEQDSLETSESLPEQPQEEGTTPEPVLENSVSEIPGVSETPPEPQEADDNESGVAEGEEKRTPASFRSRLKKFLFTEEGLEVFRAEDASTRESGQSPENISPEPVGEAPAHEQEETPGMTSCPVEEGADHAPEAAAAAEASSENTAEDGLAGLLPEISDGLADGLTLEEDREPAPDDAAAEGAGEPEAEESFFMRLLRSLAATRKRLAARLLALFGGSKIDAAFWDELEEILISADVGMEPTLELTKRLKAAIRKDGILDPAEVKPYLHREIVNVFTPPKAAAPESGPEVILVIGVNGVGKTTTIAKLAHKERAQGKTVMIAAADTFRAAAVEQLETWAKRVGCEFYAKGQNADPAAVAYEALERAQAGDIDVLFVDTAGRLHTKTNLMEELLKIRRVLNKRLPGAPHRTILVMDATTGQNGLSQARLFGESCGIDEIILTKLDGTAKGGIIVAIAMQFGIPISFVGLGEGMRDLRPFESEAFTAALLDTKDEK